MSETVFTGWPMAKVVFCGLASVLNYALFDRHQETVLQDALCLGRCIEYLVVLLEP